MIPYFKNKRFTELTNEQKLAFAERVCMDQHDYLKGHSQNTAGINFVKYWMNHITQLEKASNSIYLQYYIYTDKEGLCVGSPESHVSVRYNTKEVIAFINNVINEIPFRTPVIDALMKGHSIESLIERGILPDSYGNTLPNARGMKGMKKGKPKDPNSLAQRIERGELTRYQAYQKKEFRDNDEAL